MTPNGGRPAVSKAIAISWLLLVANVCGLPVALDFASSPNHAMSQGATSSERTGWKTYQNVNYNFSFEYPARTWSLTVGLDGNGVDLTPIDKSLFHLPPEIGAGGSVGQPSDADENRSRNLDEDFQSYLHALDGGYSRAQNITVVSRKSLLLQGFPAIVSTISFERPTGRLWFNKVILIHTKDDSTTYHLGLTCSPDDVSSLTPIFDQIVNSYLILGPRA